MRRHPLTGSLLALALAVIPIPAQAQEGFLFGPPGGSLSVRMGQARPTTNGELFESLREFLTIGQNDFASELFAADLLIRAHDRLDVGLSLAWSKGRAESIDKEFFKDLDTNGDTIFIEQTTTLRRMPLMVSARFYPLSRGESVGDYAWIPARLSPFIGAGGGAMLYKLVHGGEFVGRTPPPAEGEGYPIFDDEYETSGAGYAAHVSAGLDYWLGPRVGLTGEGRYVWAQATPESSFSFSKIDLSGFQATAGLSFRF